MPGSLFVVATPIGNLEDITLRALRILRTVSIIAAEDTRRTAILLQRHQIPTPTVSLHEHNERTRTEELVRRLLAGDSVALVSDAGTPLVSDPGAGLVQRAIAEGIPVTSIPGPSAVMTALTVSGLPADRFTFLGFAPARKAERERWLAANKELPGTLVFFEAPHRIRASLQSVLGTLGDRLVVLTRELTKVHESIARGFVSSLIEAEVCERGEYTVLVSDQTNPASMAPRELSDDEIRHEFGRLTNIEGASDRDAVQRIAEESSKSRQSVYKILRDAGDLG